MLWLSKGSKKKWMYNDDMSYSAIFHIVKTKIYIFFFLYNVYNNDGNGFFVLLLPS